MHLNYTFLLKRISKKQGLGLNWNEMSLIINTDIATYIHAVIIYEDDEYLVVIVPDTKTGAEFAKILNKNTVLSVEIIYQQMLEKPKHLKWGCMYA